MQEAKVKQFYEYNWGPSPMRPLDRKGELCEVLCRNRTVRRPGGKAFTTNSCLIRFIRDGHMTVTSRNALRKPKEGEIGN